MNRAGLYSSWLSDELNSAYRADYESEFPDW
jgi:hypothetical protein